MKHYKIDLSLKTILSVLLIIGGIYLGSQTLDIIIQLMLAFVLATALQPAVLNLQKIRVSRLVAVLWIYALLIGSLVVAMILIVPPLVEQTLNLVSQFNLPRHPIIEQMRTLQFTADDLSSLWTQYGDSVNGIITFLTSTFSAVFGFFTVLVMTLYMLLERDHLHAFGRFFFKSEERETRSKKLLRDVEYALGTWVRGEFLLMLVIGLLTFLGLTLLGIPYALPLAIIAGLLETLPNLGPTLSAVPAVIVAAVTISPLMGLATAGLYWVVQLVENNFVVPFVMKKTMGINPLTSIVLILAGFRFGGVLGALLVIPYYIVLRVVLREFGPEIRKIFQEKRE